MNTHVAVVGYGLTALAEVFNDNVLLVVGRDLAVGGVGGTPQPESRRGEGVLHPFLHVH